MRLIQETADGIMVSDGHGWREPEPNEFVPVQGGNYLDLNGERAAVAWWKGVAAGGLTVLAVVAIWAAWYAEHGR